MSKGLRVLLTMAAFLTAGQVLALGLGDRMPASAGNVEMQSVDGSKVTLARAAGNKGTLVVFTCNACPWAKAWEERIVALGNEFSGKGVGVVAVNPNDPKTVAEDDFPVMQERARQRGHRFPYVVDSTSEVARAFGASRTPEAYLFDGSGTLVYHGTIDDNAQKPEQVSKTFLRDALEAVVAGRPVAVAETKALGCTIKWRS